MKNRNLEIHHREWNLTYDFAEWTYSIFGTWEFNDYDEVSEYAFIELNVEISEKWLIETEDNLQPHVLGVRLLEDLRLEMQEIINSDLQHFEFWEWKQSNDDSNYTFYHEI
jgi:hypothetical protein